MMTSSSHPNRPGDRVQPSPAVINEVFAELFPMDSVDQLLCNPIRAIRYCNVVRSKTDPRILDRAILRALMESKQTGDA